MTFTPFKQIEQKQNGFTPASDILIQKYQAEENAKQQEQNNSSPVLDLLKGFAKGVGDNINTVNKSIVAPVEDLINKGVSKATGVPVEKLPLQNAVDAGNKIGINDKTLESTNTAQAIGKGAEQVAELAIPESKLLKGVELLKAGKVGETLLKMGASFGVGTGVSKLQGADNTQALETGTLGAIIPPVVSNGFKLLGSTLKGTAGALSGKGTKAIENILANPVEALKGLKQEGIDTIEQNAKTIQKLGSDFYKASQQEFADTLTKIKSKVKTIDSNAVNQKVSDILAENNISYSFKNGKPVVDLSGFAGDNKALLKKTFDLIKGKANDTIDGLEEIAQTINKQKLNTNNVEIKTILGNMSRAVRSAYTDQLEKMGYKKEAMIAQNYAKAQDALDTFDSMFGSDSRSKIIKESTLTDIMKKVKNLTSGDKTIELQKIAQMGGDKAAIVAKETGRMMKENITKAEASIGDTIGKMIQAALPSKTIGEATAYTGIAKDKLQPIIDFITNHPELGTTAKQALINFANSFLFDGANQ